MTYDPFSEPPRPKLPVGIQAFETLRGQGYLYVDKTRWVHRLVTQGMFYFLARPRRFGKSLLISTLKCLFEGRRELFDGLWIAEPGRWEWQAHPVIAIDFNEIGHATPADLERDIEVRLTRLARQYDVRLESPSVVSKFAELIEVLHARTNASVVVLIDEYDKPLIDHLGKGEAGLAIARANRELLRSFFGVLKGVTVSPLLRFVFLTGVSRFSRVSIFSELNNLYDLSMDDAYADMLGYTQEELETRFAPHIAALARHLDWTPDAVTAHLVQQYNGYRFTKRDMRVYNPFSILSAFNAREFANYWFASGTPTFLVNLLQQERYDLTKMEALEVSQSTFTTFEIDRLRPEALLFQTGYLTIKDVQGPVYTLDYPNQEVKTAFAESLLYVVGAGIQDSASSHVLRLARYLQREDLAAFFEAMQAIFASIPYMLSSQRDEAYFHTIFYLALTASGADAISELLTNRGRIDMAVHFPDKVYLLEFKCDQSAAAGLAQIAAQGYAERYRGSGKRVIAVGINFDTTARNVSEWRVEPAHYLFSPSL
jgi:PAS domain-containing protein